MITAAIVTAIKLMLIAGPICFAVGALCSFAAVRFGERCSAVVEESLWIMSSVCVALCVFAALVFICLVGWLAVAHFVGSMMG